MRLIFLLPALFLPFSATAQEEQLPSVRELLKGKVFRDRINPQWIKETNHLYYSVHTPDGQEHVLVDLASGEMERASKREDLSQQPGETEKIAALSINPPASKNGGKRKKIVWQNRTDGRVKLTWITSEGKEGSSTWVKARETSDMSSFVGHTFVVTDETGARPDFFIAGTGDETVIIEKDKKQFRLRERSSSQDGKFRIEVKSKTFMIRDRKSGEIREWSIQQTKDKRFREAALGGKEKRETTFGETVFWSPDSRAFLAYRFQPVETRELHMVESSPKDQLQPKLLSRNYRKPGDPLPKPELILFRLTESSEKDSTPFFTGQVIDGKLFPKPYGLSATARPDRVDIEWLPDSSAFTFFYNERGHQCLSLIAVDRKTGKARTVVEEASNTMVHYSGKSHFHYLHKTKEAIWMSERNNWNHLYLLDFAGSKISNAITSGKWVVREVLQIDDEKGRIWFYASGIREGEDPYHLHLCRANFDGTGFAQLTEADGNHTITFSPDRKSFLDKWSRADHEPVHELRDSETGELVTTLEKANLDRLLETEWQMPERFVAKGRDGKTDIHGVIIKPWNFDPKKRYPIVEQIYAGPHGAFAPKEFRSYSTTQTLAHDGCIVVQADGMGTNHRGKKFHDVAWKNLKDAGFPDRIAWIRAAAETRPWMDLNRVGIYGGSAGGQSAMRALLDHHDFYSVAVADCGCHDNRMDKIWWNEQWMGWPVDDSYAKSSNVDDAHKLQGKLLLIVGEIDTNVDPASTMQVVQALQKAGKNFEFMPIIGHGHSAAETKYGSMLRRKFLLNHLLSRK